VQFLHFSSDSNRNPFYEIFPYKVICVKSGAEKIQTALKQENEIFPTTHFHRFWIQFGARDILKKKNR